MKPRPTCRLPWIQTLCIQGAITCVAFIGTAQIQSTHLVNAQDIENFKSPQETDGSRGAGQKPAIGSQTDNKPPASAVSKQRAYDQLVAEMENLIPGKLEKNLPQKKAVEDAVTAFQLRDGQRVKEIFNEQAANDPDFPPTELLLAGLSFAVQDADTGRALLERTATQHPDSPAVYAAFSRLAINEGRVTDALALLEKMALIANENKLKLSESAKKFYEAQYLDGMTDVAMRQQRYIEARAFLAKQRELIPDNPKALMVSAELEFKEKDLAKSMEYLNQLRASFPQTRAPETIIASWYQRTDQPEEAKKWILNAATKYTDNPQVQIEVASWAVNEEDFPTASASIQKAESADKESILSKNLKAKIAFAGQSYAIAESHYESLWKMQPESFDAANMYALCLIENADETKRQQALEIASQNFRALPDNVVAQAALGYIQLRLGKLEQAKSALRRALQTKSVSPEIEFFGASLLREMKETEKAKQILENTLNRKGLFLYRSAAKKMLNELGSQDLPVPKVNK